MNIQLQNFIDRARAERERRKKQAVQRYVADDQAEGFYSSEEIDSVPGQRDDFTAGKI